jgi:medium-chain acyl-[acyl-carrier-protein] hydrolase
MPESWIRFPTGDRTAVARLFCFPHAGGGPSLFSAWRPLVGPEISTCPIQPPGREARLFEPSLTDVHEIVERVSACIAAASDKPFAFFGHSMGAIVAFEVARRLSESRPRAATPALLVASGSPPPHLAGTEKRVHLLGDRDLLAWVRGLGGTSDLVLNDLEVSRLVLLPLRADLAALARYRARGDYRFEGRTLVLGGRDDDLAPQHVLGGWRAYAADTYAQLEVPGAHFFVTSMRERVVEAVLDEMRRAIPRLRGPLGGEAAGPEAIVEATSADGDGLRRNETVQEVR